MVHKGFRFTVDPLASALAKSIALETAAFFSLSVLAFAGMKMFFDLISIVCGAWFGMKNFSNRGQVLQRVAAFLN